jgi:hypothetical protein
MGREVAEYEHMIQILTRVQMSMQMSSKKQIHSPLGKTLASESLQRKGLTQNTRLSEYILE